MTAPTGGAGGPARWPASFSVRGDGAVDVDWDGLDRGADLVRRCSADMAGAASAVLAESVDPHLLAAGALAAVQVARAEAALGRAAAAVGRQAVLLRVDAVAVEAAARLYRAAEVAALAVGTAPEVALDVAGIARDLVPGMSEESPVLPAQQLVEDLPGLADMVLRLTPPAVLGTEAAAILNQPLATLLASTVAAGHGVDLVPTTPAEVTGNVAVFLPAVPGGAVAVDNARPEAGVEWASWPPTGLGDLMERTATMYAGPARPRLPGQVAVQEVVGADGLRRYVVMIPGTEQWLPGSSNPADITSDVQILGHRPNGYGEAIRGALRQAGAPPGSDVVLIGHSLGGMAAMSLAADPTFNGDAYRVTHVVTAGSPIAGSAPAAVDTRVLAVENSSDVVPHLDAAPNPNRPGWITVGYTEQGGSLAADHDVVGYAWRMGELDRCPEPRVRAFLASLAPYTSGMSASTTSWQAVREPIR